ncbi:MAG TPA: hypothetical protein DIC34_20115 [Treponema sp.]|nr:MAG: hypothetical protein A2001_09585 [Treponema sp. GWC1_61_84]HCM28808.1 hypothetical protein [Treponema sp.]
MHGKSIPRSNGDLIEKIPVPLAIAAALCAALIAAAALTVSGILRLERMEKDALVALTRWQAIDSLTNDVLLKRASLADGGYSELLGDWERRTLDFSLTLARLNDERRLRPLGGDVISDVAGAVGLWIRAEGRLRNAQQAIRRMTRSGLASRVMVNGFLPTFYQMRLEGLLSEREIIEIREVLYALDILDATTTQFDLRLRSVVDHVSREADVRISRVAVISTVMAFGLAALAGLGFWYFRRLRAVERNRRSEKERLRRDYLFELFDPDGEGGSSVQAETALRELGVVLPFGNALRLLLLRVDRPDAAGERMSAERLRELADEEAGPSRATFPIGADMVAVLLAQEPAGAAGTEPALAFAEAVRRACSGRGATLSFALSPVFDASTDRRAMMRRMTEAFSRRYALGRGASIIVDPAEPFPGAAPQEGAPAGGAPIGGAPVGAYEYPGRADELIEKRILEGKMEEAKLQIDALIRGASAYQPTVLRSVVARISANLFASVEKLERAAGFALPSASIERLAEIVSLDTAQAARDRFASILDEIGCLLERHRSGRVADLAARTDAIIASRLAEPNLSLELVAGCLSLSASYLGRTYRKHAGISVSERINEKRLEAARTLLAGTDLTVDAIASSVGISNTGSLYRLFKGRYGITPAEYREKERADASLPGPAGSSR